jgi:sigma-B regulation protein RsbU (phosphoserine phosphatase)
LLTSRSKDISQFILEVKACAGYADKQKISELKIHPGEGITGMAAVEGQVVCINDTRLDSRYLSMDSAVLSEIAIPLIYHEEIVGVLNIESDHVNAFNENERELLGTLGVSLAAIITNTSLVEQIQHQIERQRLLSEITTRIRASNDIDMILQTAIQELGRSLGVSKTSIQLRGQDTESITQEKEIRYPGLASAASPVHKEVA